MASTTPPSAAASSRPGTPVVPVALDLDRVDRRVAEPPVDDVDRVEPAERAQPQPALADDEVGRLDEVEAEQAGERRVLDVRRRRRRRRVNSTMRGLATVDGAAERVAQLGREAADRRQVAASPSGPSSSAATRAITERSSSA